jgi:AraC-like DNA-binding protein
VFDHSDAVFARDQDEFSAWARRGAALSISRRGQAELIREPKLTAGRYFDQIGFQLVLAGSIDIMTQEATHCALPGSILVFDLRRPFRLVYGNDSSPTADVTLWLPASRLQGIHEHVAHGRVLSGKPAVAIFAAALRTLPHECKRLGASALDNVTDGIVRLAIDLLALDNPAPATATPELESFVTICGYIDANLNARNLNPANLAQAFGLSRASLYRLFEPVGGVASYIRVRRLERVRETIKEPGLMNRRIAPAAYSSGFKSIAAFNRAYRQAFGETPRQSRRGGRNPQLTLDLNGSLGPLAHCLIEIG